MVSCASIKLLLFFNMSVNPYTRFSEAEINDLGEAFKVLDKNGNGSISSAELY